MENKTVSPEYKHLVTIFRDRQGVIFCGAGISKDPPAGLPDWLKLRDYTLEAVASKDEVLRYFVDNLTSIEMIAEPGKKGLTPEFVASTILESCEGYFESFQVFGEGEPNANHQYLAKMAKAGFTRYIITTNFDLFIEQALKKEALSYRVYRTEAEFKSFELDQNGIHVLKLHGCISKPDTITATVEQEGRGLSLSKANMLRKILPDYTIIFWGYSGADLKLDIDYLKMISMKESAKGFVWSLFEERDFKEAPNSYVVELQKLYGERAIITHGLLPDVFDALLPPSDRIRKASHTQEEIEQWTDQKNNQLREFLQAWADRNLTPARSCTIYGKLLYYSGQLEAAQACYEHLLRLSEGSGNQNLSRIAHIHLCDVHFEGGNYIDALRCAKEAERIARSSGDNFALSGVLRKLGEIYGIWGRYQEALASYKEAETLVRDSGVRDSGKKHILTSLLYDAGKIYRNQGKYEEALENFQQAEGIMRELGEMLNLSVILGDVGTIFFTWGELEEALIYFEEALQIANTLGAKAVLGGCYHHILGIHLAREDNEKALEYAEEARRLAEETKNKQLLGIVLSDLATIFGRQNEHEEALKYYEEALQVVRMLDNKRNIAGVLNNIGTLYHSRDPLQARKYYQESVTILESIGDRATAGAINLSLARLHRDELNDLPQAIAYYQRSLIHNYNVMLINNIPQILHELAACRSQSSGKSEFPLLETLSTALQTEPILREAFTQIADNLDIQVNPFDLHALYDSVVEQHGREETEFIFLSQFSTICKAYRAEGRHEAGVRLCKIARQIAEEIGDVRMASIFINDAGLIYADRKQYTEALKYFWEAEQVTREAKDEYELITRLDNIGGTLAQLGQIGRGLECLEEARQIARKIGDGEQLLLVLKRMGGIYKEQKNAVSALDAFEEAEPVASRIGDLESLIEIYMGMGKVYRDEAQYESSASYRQQALQLVEAEGDVRASGHLSALIANLYDQDLNQPEVAIPYYQKSIEHLKQAGVRDVALELQTRLDACFQRVSKNRANSTPSKRFLGGLPMFGRKKEKN